MGAVFAPGGLSVAKRHGLIEAITALLITDSRSMLSVAKRHGLIEAYLVPVLESACSSVIRGKTPRPH